MEQTSRKADEEYRGFVLLCNPTAKLWCFNASFDGAVGPACYGTGRLSGAELTPDSAKRTIDVLLKQSVETLFVLFCDASQVYGASGRKNNS